MNIAPAVTTPVLTPAVPADTTGDILVTFREDVSQAQATAALDAMIGAELAQSYQLIGGTGIAAVTPAKDAFDAAIKHLTALPIVIEARPEQILRTA